MKYFYTYLLPFKPNLQFDYWKVKDADECLGKACSKYGTTNFQIGQITKACYDDAMGIKRVKLKPMPMPSPSKPEAKTEFLEAKASARPSIIQFTTISGTKIPSCCDS